MYIKLLFYIDEEIVKGTGGIRAPTERMDLDASMRVKDCLRDTCIGTIVQSWYVYFQSHFHFPSLLVIIMVAY